MAKNNLCETQTLVCSVPELPSRLQSRIVFTGLTDNKARATTRVIDILWIVTTQQTAWGKAQHEHLKHNCSWRFLNRSAFEAPFGFGNIVSYPRQGHSTANIILDHTQWEIRHFLNSKFLWQKNIKRYFLFKFDHRFIFKRAFFHNVEDQGVETLFLQTYRLHYFKEGCRFTHQPALAGWKCERSGLHCARSLFWFWQGFPPCMGLLFLQYCEWNFAHARQALYH